MNSVMMKFYLMLVDQNGLVEEVLECKLVGTARAVSAF